MLKQFLTISGFSRGALAALAFLGAAPKFVPYSVLDLVAGVHAVILGWNSIAAPVGRFFTSLFGLPELPIELVNACIMGFTLSVPYAFTILRSEWNEHHGFIQNVAFWARAFIALIQPPMFCIFFFSLDPGILFFSALLPLVLIALAVLVRLPSFRAGFLTVLGFLCMMELIYLVSTDSGQAAFDGFVCAHESVGLPRCLSGN